MNDKPKLSFECRATLQVTQPPRERGKLVTVNCMGPGQKSESGEWSAMWVTVQAAVGKDAHAALVRLQKGDRFEVDGRLFMSAPWTTRDGERREGSLTMWADAVLGSEPHVVDEPIGEDDIPF